MSWKIIQKTEVVSSVYSYDENLLLLLDTYIEKGVGVANN